MIWHGRTIGDSEKALELHEANYPPVVYVPRADMEMSALERTARAITTRPYKGEANYYFIADGKARDDNAVWTYELPKRRRRDRVPPRILSGQSGDYPRRLNSVPRAG